MNPFPPPPDLAEFESITKLVSARLAQNQRVRRTLPGAGRLRIDRQLPFLCVYRAPEGDDAGTRELVTTEAAYLFTSGADSHHAPVQALCRSIIDLMLEHFGMFLIIEIWADRSETADEIDHQPLRPGFEIVAPDANAIPSIVETLREALGEIKIGRIGPDVTVRTSEFATPPGMPPLAGGPADDSEGCLALGLAVRPIYQDRATGALFPLLLQTIRSQLTWALRKTVAQFSGHESTKPLDDYKSLGPTSLVKATQLVDAQLCEVAESFDFLLQCTPTNFDHSWRAFRESRFKHKPDFFYRPLPYRPNLIKRRLFDIEIERVEDATMSHLFWEKQEELDRQLTALRDLDQPRFLWSSLQLYSAADDSLVSLAERILRQSAIVPADSAHSERLSVKEIAEIAREEIDHYQSRMVDFQASIQVCDHIAAGMMVTRDTLLIARKLKVTPELLAPLLHHEVGTHLLTYFNGRVQPFRQLAAGLAGYDELQEGLAVLTEYLTGGLSRHRIRILAGRVIAVRSMTDDDGFANTFARLHEEFGFSLSQSYSTTLRAYRGGGLTKDVIYLRGLRDVLEYIAQGHDLEPLYVGKIGLQHLPYIQEMRRRGIIRAPGVLPRCWTEPGFVKRLESCRGRSVLELLETPP